MEYSRCVKKFISQLWVASSGGNILVFTRIAPTKIPRRVAILFFLTPFIQSFFSHSLQIACIISDVNPVCRFPTYRS